MGYNSNLIIDVGMFDGTDSAYYLHKGYRVIAIEADPILCEKAQRRFSAEILEEKLVILNLGISHRNGDLTFYRNRKAPEKSSFNRPDESGILDYETLQVPCVVMRDILLKYGIPHYLKIDIEGSDEFALASLTEDICPPYLSTELNFTTTSLDRLVALGYSSFKLINQMLHTQDFDMHWISDKEIVYRGIRKLGRLVPAVRWLMMSLPKEFRNRSEWARPYRPDGWVPPTESWSGPLGEETHGTWMSIDEAKQKFESVRRDWPGAWWDVHARKDWPTDRQTR